jgi:hypothetical protein
MRLTMLRSLLLLLLLLVGIACNSCVHAAINEGFWDYYSYNPGLIDPYVTQENSFRFFQTPTPYPLSSTSYCMINNAMLGLTVGHARLGDVGFNRVIFNCPGVSSSDPDLCAFQRAISTKISNYPSGGRWVPATPYTEGNTNAVDANSYKCQMSCAPGYATYFGYTSGQISCYVNSYGELTMGLIDYACIPDAARNMSPVSRYITRTVQFKNLLVVHDYTFALSVYTPVAYCPLNLATILSYWSQTTTLANATRFKTLGNCGASKGFIIAGDTCAMGCMPRFTVQYTDTTTLYPSYPIITNCVSIVNNVCVQQPTTCELVPYGGNQYSSLIIPDYSCGYQYALASCASVLCVGNAAGGMCTDAYGNAIPVTATGTTEGYCTQCASGWGPAQPAYLANTGGSTQQSLTAVQIATRYLYQWCSVPYGQTVARADVLKSITTWKECNGVGFFVDPALIISAFSITYNGAPLPVSMLRAYDPSKTPPGFDTHPSLITGSLQARFGSGNGYSYNTDRSALDLYNQNVYTISFTAYPTCAYCDPGYSLYGATCILDTTQPWIACHSTDRACSIYSLSQNYGIIGNSYPTGLACGQMMYTGAAYYLPRGQPVVRLYSPQMPAMYCACSDGYAGGDCGQVRCAWSNGQSCSANGQCDEPSNRCICNAGWVGAACEIPLASCNAHGQTRLVNPPPTNNPQGDPVPAGAEVPNAYLLTQTVWY